MFFLIEDGKYKYFLRKKKKSKVFYADEINTEGLSIGFCLLRKTEFGSIWK